MVTSSFSHASMSHFLINMFVFFSFGMPVAAVMGQLPFLRLYLAAAVSTALAHIGYYTILLPRLHPHANLTDPGSIGASGCVMAVMTYFAARAPRATVLLLIIPVPAWLAVSLFITADLFGAFKGGGSGVRGGPRIDNAVRPHRPRMHA
ncbi:hypothetical protein PTSG_10773 [Salpingoeca rosetta]|uniref:Peptidase S54 rhomboid domain-containing protein n=1 Tax=Salpingoeca rosetta (strain ATCC 50818 / BSB-021) TaxID=946362 RepID=F2UQC0_SALR5|nr:uncharacterized protein PTSG_10773 [Salpingoeca rosetta]EGD79788.1 hypothetical protein PTSG_10773 [Salpingoeca rosetta]|eukprot:XP_004988737.1 hypothetical protein PTSG_10773 [Salpingoeca rosetta]